MHMGAVQYDVERMGSLLSDIKNYFDDLEAMHIQSVEDLHDKRKSNASPPAGQPFTRTGSARRSTEPTGNAHLP
jgi:hypothetical protein